jgi:hypothetical protein
MKKLFMGLGVLVLTIFMLVGTSLAYTYDGDVDPAELSSWTATSEASMCEPGVGVIELSNTTGNHPDIDVGKVYLVQMANGTTILAYEYHYKSTDKTRYFEIHPRTGNYDEVDGFDNGTFEERYVNKLQ